MTDALSAPSPAPPPRIEAELLQEFRKASKAPETWRAVRKNWTAFAAWCGQSGRAPYPATPETLEAYLVHLAAQGRRPSTVEQARYAIDARHKWAGLAAPGDHERVRVAMAGIRRKLRGHQRRKQALTIDHLKRLDFPDTLVGKRDKALLLLGFAGGFRRSELAAIRVEDVEETPTGIRVTVPFSKADQEGRGEAVSIVRSTVSSAWCPVEALRDWLAAAEIGSGPLFRSIPRNGRLGESLSPKWIYQVVKRAAEACGSDPAQFGGHSLRSGCATYLLDRGVPLNVVSQHLRHKRLDTTLKYDRNATAKALTGVY